jgi:hypothetical protein
MLDMISEFAPHLDGRIVQEAQACFTTAERERLFEAVELPNR